VFLIGIPPLLLLLLLAKPLLPEFRHPGTGRIDLVSVGLSIGSIVAIVYGLKETAKDGLHLSTLLVMAVGAIGAFVFARRQVTLPEPLLDLRLFHRSVFSVSLGAQTFGLFVLAAMQFLSVQYFQLVLGMTPLEAGLWMLPMAVSGIVGTMAAPLIARRLPAGTAMTLGFAVALPGLFLMALSGRGAVVAGMTIASVGIQVVLALTYDLVVSSVPPERAGVASGMGETGTEFGMALGVAVAGSVVTAVYRAQVTDLPAGVPSAARDTLGSAVAAVEQLPAPLAREVLELARGAYTDGVQLAALLSAAIIAVLGVATATLIRNR
jgi:DHA2 family multidrug resistance protein-like MFS transporter